LVVGPGGGSGGGPDGGGGGDELGGGNTVCTGYIGGVILGSVSNKIELSN